MNLENLDYKTRM